MPHWGHVIHENRPSRIYHFALNDHRTRWPISSDGPGSVERFIDHERVRDLREVPEHGYSVYHAGAHPGGCAALVGTARSFREAIALAKTRPLLLGARRE
jgi:hypothetical protein